MQSHRLKHVLVHPSTIHGGFVADGSLRLKETPSQMLFVPQSPEQLVGFRLAAGVGAILARATKLQVAVGLVPESLLVDCLLLYPP